MEKVELLPLLRKIRIEHLCDTEMRETAEVTDKGEVAFSRIEFDVKAYIRIRTQVSTVGAQAEEAVLEEAFTFAFRFGTNGELIEVSSWFGSIPL